MQDFGGGVLIAVVDGLGHGSEATAAADLAITVLQEHASESVLSLVQRCHAALRQTRGAVMNLASYREAEAAVTWLGIGNVEGVLLRVGKRPGGPREDILTRPGVVGFQLPPLRAAVVPVTRNDLLLFATDGVQSDFKDDVLSGQTPKACAERILALHVKPSDDALVLAARFPAAPYEHQPG